MQAINRPFSGIINGSTQFIIPVFQRDYRWEEGQCRQLWNDIDRAAIAPAGRGHFMGSMVYIATGDTFAGFTRWLLIDGQQRLTTLTLLLTALRDHIRETKWTGGDDGPSAPRIDAYFLQNSHEEGERRRKLVLRRRDNETLAALVSGTELPHDPSPRVLEAYELFRELLTGSDPARVYAGVNKLVLVDVVLDRLHDDPQLVFESLNSTGVDLTQSDLIRNFILMRLPEKEQTRLYETGWSRIEALFRGGETAFDSFLRDYIALRTRATKQVKSDGIYTAFRQLWSTLTSRGESVEDIVADLKRFAAYHAAFSLGRVEAGPIHDALASLRRLVDVPAILVMRLFACRDESSAFAENELVEALRLTESYIVRRAVCRLQSRGYWQVFASLAYSLDPAAPLESLRTGLALQRDAYRFPDDATFRVELESCDLYSLRVCRHVLETLENHGSKEPAPVATYTIEHIMPQTEKLSSEWRAMLGTNWKDVQATWLHRLGNLTLTAYNSEYSANPFSDKKTMKGGFGESAVRLNKTVRDATVWTAVEIENRGNQLGVRACTVWPPLAVTDAAMKRAYERRLREQAEATSTAPLNMSDAVRPIFEALKKQIEAAFPSAIALTHKASVSYHAPEFFVEVLPRKRYLTVILPIDFSQVDNPPDFVGDATEWDFFVNAQHTGGVYVTLRRLTELDAAMVLIRSAYQLA